MDVAQLVNLQKKYFAESETKDISFRFSALRKLELGLEKEKHNLLDALYADLGKVHYEGYMAEYSLVMGEITLAKKNLKKWVRTEPKKSVLANFHSKSFVMPEPYGNVLIMSPWNYPLLLTLMPLIGAISAGNTAVVKPSNYSGNTSRVIHRIVSKCFPCKYVAVVLGGREENAQLLAQKYDYIFFTGGETVGRIVMRSAAENLTPLTLELGGKSPCIIEDAVDVKLVAKRVIFGKLLNAGQTCIAPDYILLNRKMEDALKEEFPKVINEFLGETPLLNDELPKIINLHHYNRLLSLMEKQNILCGGESDEHLRKISPAILWDVSPKSLVMQEEIFGPLLPVVLYNTLDEAVEFVNSRPKPLALYLFSNKREVQQKVLNSCSFGGGCINDTIVHIASPHIPFGGVGASGMGSYHGEKSFETFSHYKSVLEKSNYPDIKLRYHPYTKKKFNLLEKILK